MKRKIITTSDGSKTIQIEDLNEQYHSIHGAVQEAKHVFIKNGLALFKNREISILEIGFGTGLNALITLMCCKDFNLKINYTGVEAYPVMKNELDQLNYIDCLQANDFVLEYIKMHESAWEANVFITDEFVLKKRQEDFLKIEDVQAFDLIYFDAFGARVQPELWTKVIFEKMFTAMKNEAVLVTYSAKGSVRRAMQAVGFEVERLPGPPGKREMLRARKLK
ncbi:tRNA (5-methylaminomethyl-2-thiouridine)(34)-methyltransferase MnmD [Aurantibacter sp.]|uniref:tRNA (5-methylaminomethyl-2-thiouridine)(34)-methyltransferase MnmD n=1 Tax=Aurantibacter sp. TaxID=2807103 RepID=UPI0032668249